MTSFTSLLVVTDLSAEGNNAVRRAASVAQGHGAPLHILHMLDAKRGWPFRHLFARARGADADAWHARAVLRRMAEEIAGNGDLNCTVEVAAGNAAERLVQAAAASDLVVVAGRSHGHRSLPWAGHALSRLARACARPVLVVKAPHQQPYRRVLVPVDFTACSDAALRLAAWLQREADVHVFHALDSRRDAVLREADVPEHIVRESRLLEEAGALARMRRRAARLGLEDTRALVAVTPGPVLRSTLRHARRVGADLVVAGLPGRSSFADLVLGSVGRSLLSQTACDTLVVPEPRTEARPKAQATPSAWIHNTARFMPRRPS